MADQQRWFKFWTTAPYDDDLQQLPPELRWAWVVLGAYTKANGTAGRVTLSPSNAALCGAMCVKSDALIDVVKSFPHVCVEEGTNRYGTFTVTWNNWEKYQEDSTVPERMRRYRARQPLRYKRRREEIRRDEKRSTPPNPLAGGSGATEHPDHPPPPAPAGTEPANELLDFLNRKTGRHYRPVRATLDLIRARLRSGATPDQVRAVIVTKWRQWRDRPDMVGFLRPVTLFRASNFESYLGQLPASAFQAHEEI